MPRDAFMRRRDVISAVGASLALLPLQAAWSQATDDLVPLGNLPPLPSDLAANAAAPPAPYAEIGVVGTAPPSTAEIDTAFEILINSPWGKNVRPIDVALYFLSVGSGAYGESWRPFAREWPIRANPVIFHFFSATQTKPEGDTTSWCAAFANWCILRSGAASREQIGTPPGFFSKPGLAFKASDIQAYSTFSASSGSFRCWKESNSPSRGDIAVFANKGTEELTAVCRGQGHVAFVIEILRPGWVRVVGGNQSAPGSGGAVTVSDMKTSSGSRFLKYVSLKGEV